MRKVVEDRCWWTLGLEPTTHNPMARAPKLLYIRSRPYNKRVCVFSSVATSGNVRCQLFIFVEDSEAYRVSLEDWNSLLS